MHFCFPPGNSFSAYAIATVVVLLFAITGCNSSKQSPGTPQYQAMFKHIDTIPIQNTGEVIDSLSVLFKQKAPDALDRIMYHRAAANYALEYSEFTEALAQLDTLRQILDAHKKLAIYTREYSEMLLTKSDVYTAMKRYDDGINSLTEAKLFIDKNISDSCRSAELNRKIADMLYGQKRYKLSAEYYLETYRQSQRCNDNPFDKFYQGQSTLRNAGTGYYDAGELDTAANYYYAAIAYIKENGPKFPEKASYIALCDAVVTGNLGALRADQLRFEEAEKLLRHSLQGTAEHYPGFSNGSRLLLAKLYINWNKLHEAEQLLNILDTIHNGAVKKTPQSLEEWSMSQKILWEKRGDAAKALQYVNMHIAVRDSMDLVNQKNMDRDLGMEFAAKEQKATNSILKRENEQQSTQLLVALLIIMLVLVITIFVIYNLRRTSTHLKKLETLHREIRERNEDLKDAYGSLEKSHNANTLLMRMVAHDLKNPIGGILGISRILLKRDLPDPAKEMLEMVATASSDSIKLINDLVKVERKGHAEISKQPDDIYLMLKHCINMMNPKAQEKRQRLQLEGESFVLDFNKDKMWRVVNNMINNAIKFSPENATIYVKLKINNEDVVISVRDEGIGIPEHLKDKIFQMSSEASRAGTNGEASNGLGLAISKKIVEEHEGQFWFESIEGNGCTFFVKLSLAERALDTASAAASTSLI